LKRPKLRESPLDVGDVVHVRGELTDGLFVVVGILGVSFGRCPVLAELLWDGGAIPDDETLARLPLLHEEDPISLNDVTRPVQHFWWVDCPSRGKNALANFGEVVARDVLCPGKADQNMIRAAASPTGPR
jgi:hypothetical protein